MDLRRGVKSALIDDLAGEQQLGRFFEAKTIAFAMRNFDFWHARVPPHDRMDTPIISQAGEVGKKAGPQVSHFNKPI
ncbi:MAG: hypothetical protein E6Z15_00865 [Paenibacillus macerans]|nr:hypothetical protein [Paenibacillus macerans]